MDDIDGEAPPPSYGNVMEQEYSNTAHRGGQLPFDDSIYSTPHESDCKTYNNVCMYVYSHTVEPLIKDTYI